MVIPASADGHGGTDITDPSGALAALFHTASHVAGLTVGTWRGASYESHVGAAVNFAQDGHFNFVR